MLGLLNTCISNCAIYTVSTANLRIKLGEWSSEFGLMFYAFRLLKENWLISGGSGPVNGILLHVNVPMPDINLDCNNFFYSGVVLFLATFNSLLP